MRKTLLFLVIPAILASCNTGKSPADGTQTLTMATNMENVDSLATVIPSTWKNLETLTDTLAFSGRFSSQIDTVHEYSVVYENKLSNINEGFPKKAVISANVCSLVPGSTAILVCSVSNNKFYSGASVDSVLTNINEWKSVSAEFNLPEDLGTEDVIKAYVWNKKNGLTLVDDLKLQLVY